jgi:H+/Cl- antiporter ClcA|tara:strand:- start:1099 stop:1470 length:372 start_codon:yes stop_codon:yes gene_type:complete
MEHLLELYVSNLPSNMKGFIFGFVHVGIMLIGYYSGWSINRFLKFASKGYIAGIIGAVLSHIFADLIASYIDPHIRGMIFGIVIGGLLPLGFIPILEKLIKKKNKHHIVTGDHEDIKKDLDSH